MVDFSKHLKGAKNMPAAKKTAAKKSTSGSKAIVRWDEKFAKYAKEGKEQFKNVTVSGVGVKFGRGSISVNDSPIQGGKLDCVIIGQCGLNKWYAGIYDPDSKEIPDCYAFAVLPNDPDMKPHPDCGDPQAEDCASCDKHPLGTDNRGRGRACPTTARIGLLTAKDVGEGDAATAELAVGGVSSTNVKHLKAYVEWLESEHGRPLWAVVTRIQSFDDPKTQIRLQFEFVELVEDDDTLDALEKRYLKIQDVLQQPYQKVENAAPTKKTTAKKTATKKSTRKFAK